MPIRNPFARRPGVAATPARAQDENNSNSRPGSVHCREEREDRAHPGFERIDTVGSKASSSSAWSIRSGRKSQDTGEYKMSVVNDSGVYLPPSPIEEKAIWPRRYLSPHGKSGHRRTNSSIDAGEIEHFPISRESFDSYRRSFDISAKSPVVTTSDRHPRQSLDSSRFFATRRTEQYTPRSSRRPAVLVPEDPEDSGREFEDVVLGDEKPLESQQKKKTGFFSRLGNHEAGESESGGWSFGMVGRKSNHHSQQQQQPQHQQQPQQQELGVITRSTDGMMKGVEVEA